MPKDSSEIKPRPVNIKRPVFRTKQKIWHWWQHFRAITKPLGCCCSTRPQEILNCSTVSATEAWIGGPGVGGWGMSVGAAGWMPDGKSIWFQSEVSGYSHLYTMNTTETKEKKALTAGKFEVSDPIISKDKKWFYFTANIKHPGISHFYKKNAN